MDNLNEFANALKLERLALRTIECYIDVIGRFLEEYGELTQDTYEEWREDTGHLSSATIRQRMSIIGRYAGFVGVSIDFGAQPRIHRGIPVAVTPQQCGMIVDAMKNPRHRLAVWLMSELGLRVSEACSLRWEDIDLSSRTVTVLRKGGDRQTLPILGDILLASLPRIERRNEYVLGGLTRKGVASAVRRACEKVGIEAHPHAFRHGFSVKAAKQGVAVPYIQQMLGHSSVNTTSRYLAGLQTNADELRAAFGS